MTVSLTCRACGKVLSADDEDALVELGAEHSREHGHCRDRGRPLSRDRILARIRRHNRADS